MPIPARGDLLVLNTADAFGLDGSDIVDFDLLAEERHRQGARGYSQLRRGTDHRRIGMLDMDGIVDPRLWAWPTARR